jgi:hypothetical protein
VVPLVYSLFWNSPFHGAIFRACSGAPPTIFFLAAPFFIDEQHQTGVITVTHNLKSFIDKTDDMLQRMR